MKCFISTIEWNRAKNISAPIFAFLGALFFRRKTVEERQKVLQNEFGIPMTAKMDEEVKHMCNLSEGIFEEGVEVGEARGMAKGMAKGMAQGEAKGKAIGERKATLRLIRNLIESMKVTVQQAFDILKIPESDRNEYLKELQTA